MQCNKNEPTACYNKMVARPAPKITDTILIVPAKLHRRCPLLTFNAFCVVRPALVVGGPRLVTFRNNCVGNMFGVAETWNMGDSGAPSYWNRCSLYPVCGSWNICHITYNSVSL